MTLLVTLMPFKSESLHGFLIRLAHENLVPSVTHLLKPVGLKPRLSYPDELLARISVEFGLDSGVLEACNPAAEYSQPLLNPRFQRALLTPVCPQCLAEQAFLRQAWAHELITACIEHGTRLIERCPNCSEPISLNRAAVAFCGCCGFALAEAPAVLAEDHELGLAALLASAEHPARGALPGALASGEAPLTIGEFLRFLAAHIQLESSGKTTRKVTRPSSLEESRVLINRVWTVLGVWPDTLQQFIHARIQAGEGPGLKKRLGSWYGMLHKEFSDSAYSFFRDELTSIIVQKFDGHINLRLRTISPDRQEEKTWLSAGEAARLVGVGEQIFAALVANNTIPGRVQTVGKSRFISVERSVVEQLDAVRKAHLSATDARKRLGVSKVFFERFIQAGGLKRLAKAERPTLVSGEYRLEDVDAVVKLLLSQVTHKAIPAEYSIGIQDISGKRGVSNDRVCSTLQDILHNVVKPVELVAGMPGIAGLRFDRREIQERLDDGQQETVFLITELVRASGWKHECIKAWIQGGYLDTSLEKRGKRWVNVIPLSALIRFMSRYAVLADLAQRSNSKSNWLLQSLRPAEISEAVAPTNATGVRRGILLSVDDLLRGAQLRRSPKLSEIADTFCSTEKA